MTPLAIVLTLIFKKFISHINILYTHDIKQVKNALLYESTNSVMLVDLSEY